VPKIKFSQVIARMPPHAEGINRYVIYIENSGCRSIIDIEIRAIITIPGLFSDLPHIKQDVILETAFTFFPFLKSGRKGNLPSNRMMFRLLPHLNSEFDRKVYPENIRHKRQDKSLTLDDLMSINDYVTVTIVIFCYDEFSGARRMFVSKAYRKTDVQSGVFEETSLEFIPSKNG
jgi:hypothetical protein